MANAQREGGGSRGSGGQSFDSHHHPSRFTFLHHHHPTVINSFPDTPSTSSIDETHLKRYPIDRTVTQMDVRRHKFPIILNDESPVPLVHHGNRVIDEMDFFAMSSTSDRRAEDQDSHHRLDGDEDREVRSIDQLELNVNTGLNLLTVNTSSDQSTVDDGISPNAEDKRARSELAMLQAEVGRLSAENQRLKTMLSQVASNYDTLRVHFSTLMQDQKVRSDTQLDPNEKRHGAVDDLPLVPTQLMDVGPNKDDLHTPSASSEDRSPDQSGIGSLVNNTEDGSTDVSMDRLDRNSKRFGKRSRRMASPDQRVSTQGWRPNKVQRFSPPKNNNDMDQTEATMRKARVSVRARSEAAMITDGCQWRKYGQKMAKGNPCPRAYYRCTMAAGCPVRKQVQRCSEDQTILITTYEGSHNHPLPPTAMAMASTTSSAARMLLSGSMSSNDGMMNTNFLSKTLLPCSSSMATISASAPFPTVTLDLTQNPNSASLLQSPPPTQLQAPLLNPNQSFPNNHSAALLPQIFGHALYNQSKFSGLQTSQDIKGAQSSSESQGMNDNLTAALTSDPNFTAALAAAISSLMGSGSSNASNSASNSIPGSGITDNNMSCINKISSNSND